MTTICLMLRSNRTMKRKRIKDKADDFKFEGGLYFVKREKVFLWSKGLSGKQVPHLLYLEGVSEPIYIDNFRFKTYTKLMPMLDKNNRPILDEKGKPLMQEKEYTTMSDIFIDSRAIHNMTDKKILDVLSATDEFSKRDWLFTIFFIAIIVLNIINLAT